MVYNNNVYIFLPNIGTVMKKLLLIASCLFLSDVCHGCQKPTEPLNNRYVKTAVAQQALPYKYYELRDSKCMFMTLDNLSMHDNYDCPVPSPKKKSPEIKNKKSFTFDEFDDHNAFNMHCPVPSPKKK